MNKISSDEAKESVAGFGSRTASIAEGTPAKYKDRQRYTPEQLRAAIRVKEHSADAVWKQLSSSK